MVLKLWVNDIANIRCVLMKHARAQDMGYHDMDMDIGFQDDMNKDTKTTWI